jgi:epoxyqueuosine reductase
MSARGPQAKPESIKAMLMTRAASEGFDVAGITTPDRIGAAGQYLTAFLEAGRHGDMTWMADHAERRCDPAALWPEARSILMLGMNYGPDHDPRSIRETPRRGAFAVYAHGRDYHDVIKGKLKALAGWLHAQTGDDVKVFVDTAPVMEKPLAQAAGIGWQGKHTNLVSRDFGSWLFLGAIFSATPLPPDEPETSHCGSCNRCLDICPTHAFPKPYQLDARRCISYLTIEYKGHIPRAFRRAIGNRVYGCDDCLAVCPWNSFAATAREAKFAARPIVNAPLDKLITMTDAEFRQAFAGTAIKRIGRDRFIRNVLIAVGNSGATDLAQHAAILLNDANPLVRAMAVWTMHALKIDPEILAELRKTCLSDEMDENVRAEWAVNEEKLP